VPSPRRRKLFALASLVGAALLGLLLAELALRAVAEERYHVWHPGEERLFHPDPEAIPGVSGPGLFRINEQGMRGDPFGPGDTLRILAAGGSTTEALYLDEAEAWPRLLQGALNRRLGAGARVRVGNVGRSGHTTRHHRLQAAQLLAQHEDVDLMLVLTGVNDLLRRLARDGEWEPTEPERLVREAFAVHPGWDSRFPFYKRTELWRKARALLARPDDSGVAQDDSGQVFYELRRYRREARRIRLELPDLGRALDEYEENLRAIAASARQHGVVPVLVTQPALWREGLPDELRDRLWAGGVGSYFGGEEADYYSVEALAEAMARYNRRLLDSCAALELACIDLASALPREADLFYDDVHFNEAGSRAVADYFAEELSAILTGRSSD